MQDNKKKTFTSPPPYKKIYKYWATHFVDCMETKKDINTISRKTRQEI